MQHHSGHHSGHHAGHHHHSGHASGSYHGQSPQYQTYQILPGFELAGYHGGAPSSPSIQPSSTALGTAAVRYYDVPGSVGVSEDQDVVRGDYDQDDFLQSKMNSEAPSYFEELSAVEKGLFAASIVFGIFVGALAVYTAWVNYRLLNSQKFEIFSYLGSGVGFSLLKFTAVASIVGACLVLFAAFLGCLVCLPIIQRLQVQTAGATVAAFVGVVLPILIVTACLVSTYEKPRSVRAVNLICQDFSVWECSPLKYPTTIDPLATMPPSTTPPMVVSGLPPPPMPNSSYGLAPENSSAQRRLSPVEVAFHYVEHYVESLEDGELLEPGFGDPQRCAKLQELCQPPPPPFDLETACLCSGKWRPGLWTPEYARDGPWNATEGAYCADWDVGEANWCFVSDKAVCPGYPVELKGSNLSLHFKPTPASSGPCVPEVQSRSQILREGHDEHAHSLLAPFLLGLASLLLAGLLFAAVKATSAAPLEVPADSKRYSQEYSSKFNGRKMTGQGGQLSEQMAANPRPSWDDKAKSLESRFKRAQKEAIARLNIATPQDLKMLLYSFYQQAKEGDVQGPRPQFYYPFERSKWDAWEAAAGMSREEAIEGYIMAVGLLEM